MKVLAIGGAGNVGSAVVKELLKRKAQVDVLPCAKRMRRYLKTLGQSPAIYSIRPR